MTTAVLKIQSKVESIDFPSVNWKMVCICGFALCALLLVFYVLQVNDLTRGYYLINTYQKQISKLTQENKNTEVLFAESSFWGQAAAKIEALNFEKVTSVKYIQIPDSSVATIKK